MGVYSAKRNASSLVEGLERCAFHADGSIDKYYKLGPYFHKKTKKRGRKGKHQESQSPRLHRRGGGLNGDGDGDGGMIDTNKLLLDEIIAASKNSSVAMGWTSKRAWRQTSYTINATHCEFI